MNMGDHVLLSVSPGWSITGVVERGPDGNFAELHHATWIETLTGKNTICNVVSSPNPASVCDRSWRFAGTVLVGIHQISWWQKMHGSAVEVWEAAK